MMFKGIWRTTARLYSQVNQPHRALLPLLDAMMMKESSSRDDFGYARWNASNSNAEFFHNMITSFILG